MCVQKSDEPRAKSALSLQAAPEESPKADENAETDVPE